eukprot:3307106-Prymnesium_polylepis.1
MVTAALKKVDEKRKPKDVRVTEDQLMLTMRGLARYLLFFGSFLVVAFSTRSSTDYWANHGMQALFVSRPFFFGFVTHEKTLYDVQSVPQFFTWLKGPLVETLHTPSLGAEPLFLNGYSRVIGPVRLRQVRSQTLLRARWKPGKTQVPASAPRFGSAESLTPPPAGRWQVRVRPDSCVVPEMFSSLIPTCYAPYELALHDEAPFGPPDQPQRWMHSSQAELDGSIADGRFASYSGGGHVLDLPGNLSAATEAILQLEQYGWIDRASKAARISSPGLSDATPAGIH